LVVIVAAAACVPRVGPGDTEDAGTVPDSATRTPDAARPDAGLPGHDAGTPDAAQGPDGRVPDAAPLDAAGSPDQGAPDAARPDAWSPDAGHPDANSPPDAWVPDAHVADAARPDAAPRPDAARPDAARPDARVDLGWPWDAAVPPGCGTTLPDPAGTAWDGWANYQHPPRVEAQVGVSSPPVFGQVWQDQVTSVTGQAPGWSGELLVGPWGAVPTTDGRCWAAIPATFNTDVGNNDEYRAALTPAAPGLYGLFFRFRPPGGAWRYGDRNGSQDGLQAREGGLLVVSGNAGPGTLVVATLNLRCRIDDWPARFPLVVQALARVDPDLVALQEDCTLADGPSQADDIRARLSVLTGRGYDAQRASTHPATYDGTTYDEGVSILSAHPVDRWGVLDLPWASFGRKAISADVTVRGQALRLYSTHLEYGTQNESTRVQELQAILADVPGDRPTLLLGDFNARPDSSAVAVLRPTMTDAWSRANPSLPGLSFPAHNPTGRIDYIWISSSHGDRVQGARMLDDRAGSTWLSDHRGVAAAFRWP
jgi:endonuclease/exonuclease/phosphatase family metal-dependent hydrolase